MAAEIRLGHIRLSEKGYFIIPGNDLPAVRVIHGRILSKAVASIAYCKMRPHLLGNKDRQLVANGKPSGHGVGRSVGTDGELAQRQPVMIPHNDLLYKSLALSAGLSGGSGSLTISGVSDAPGSPSGLTISGLPGAPILLKIPTGILRHLTVLKHHAQIPELIILHINILYVQQSFCPLQNRGCKNLSQRNVHIGHTVLKIGLLFPVF